MSGDTYCRITVRTGVIDVAAEYYDTIKSALGSQHATGRPVFIEVKLLSDSAPLFLRLSEIDALAIARVEPAKKGGV